MKKAYAVTMNVEIHGHMETIGLFSSERKAQKFSEAITRVGGGIGRIIEIGIDPDPPKQGVWEVEIGRGGEIVSAESLPYYRYHDLNEHFRALKKISAHSCKTALVTVLTDSKQNAIWYAREQLSLSIKLGCWSRKRWCITNGELMLGEREAQEVEGEK